MAHILCVDDDVQVVELKRVILEKSGYRVDTSLSVEDALQKLELNAYDAVVTDWWFGHDHALRVIRKAKSSRSIPVLIVSGFVADALVSLGTAADVYLHKPLGAMELTTALDNLLNKSQGNVAENTGSRSAA
jgi:DNA-binding response OmpR family regulator